MNTNTKHACILGTACMGCLPELSDKMLPAPSLSCMQAPGDTILVAGATGGVGQLVCAKLIEVSTCIWSREGVALSEQIHPTIHNSKSISRLNRIIQALNQA